MNQIDSTSLRELLQTQAKPAVTLYIPMVISASPPHISENQIRFKNLINKAIELLDQKQADSTLSRDLTELREKYHNDLSFWEQPAPAILLCATPERIEMFQLPIDTEEYVAVDDSFHLAPVIGLVGDQREFYVLALAQQDPMLYRGDMYGLSPTKVNFPRDAAEALNIDEPNQKSENQGSATAPSNGGGSYNGRGGSGNPQDQDRIRFFRIINKIITDNLAGSAPLILAGVDADVAEFRHLATHPTILEGSLSGNYSEAKLDDLFKEAYSIAWQELVAPDHAAAIEEYKRLEGANPERIAPDKASVQAAVEQGRVDKLLTLMSRRTTDTVQDGMASLPRITFPEAEISKSINALAAKVYQMSGKVINLMPHEMPHGSLMVARLRY